MKIPHYFLILFFGLFTSCISSPEFLKEYKLAHELMPLKGTTSPCYIEIKHPFLIIQNYNRNDSIFHIYNINSKELKSAFGTIGRGPEEFLSPYLFSTQLQDMFIEDGQDLLYDYKIDSSGMPILMSKRIPNYIEGVLGAAFINDTLYVRDGMFISADLQLLTFEDELPRKYRQYRDPNIRNCFIDPDYGHTYANSTRIILCYHFKKQIDFMDIDLNLIKRVKFRYTSPEKITEDNQFETKVSYSTGYLGKRYLYLLFRGTSWNKYKEMGFTDSSLEVFDLDGNPIISYHLNGIAPNSFVVDEVDFTLYGIRDDGEPVDNIIVYKLVGLF